MKDRLTNAISVSFGDLDYCALISEAQRSGVIVQDLIRSAVTRNLRSRTLTHGLTPREREVVVLMAEGLSNKLIADKLDISDHTAKFHITNVMRKLKVDNRAAVAAVAVRIGLA